MGYGSNEFPIEIVRAVIANGIGLFVVYCKT